MGYTDDDAGRSSPVSQPDVASSCAVEESIRVPELGKANQDHDSKVETDAQTVAEVEPVEGALDQETVQPPESDIPSVIEVEHAVPSRSEPAGELLGPATGNDITDGTDVSDDFSGSVSADREVIDVTMDEAGAKGVGVDATVDPACGDGDGSKQGQADGDGDGSKQGKPTTQSENTT